MRPMTTRRPKGELSNEDRDLFRREVGSVRPLSRSDRRSVRPSPPSPRARSRERDDAEVMASLLDDFDENADTGEALSYRQAGVQLSVLRRLRRGHYRCQASLDLHGMFVDHARSAVIEFLQEARDRDYRCVRIVHGKGLRSGNRGPVLKGKLSAWLRRRREVLAFTSARRVDGGTGAVYVLLQR